MMAAAKSESQRASTRTVQELYGQHQLRVPEQTDPRYKYTGKYVHISNSIVPGENLPSAFTYAIPYSRQAVLWQVQATARFMTVEGIVVPRRRIGGYVLQNGLEGDNSWVFPNVGAAAPVLQDQFIRAERTTGTVHTNISGRFERMNKGPLIVLYREPTDWPKESTTMQTLARSA